MNESAYPHIFGVGSANAVLYSPSLSKNAVNHIQWWWDMSLNELTVKNVSESAGWWDTILGGILYVVVGNIFMYEN